MLSSTPKPPSLGIPLHNLLSRIAPTYLALARLVHVARRERERERETERISNHSVASDEGRGGKEIGDGGLTICHRVPNQT